MMHGDPLLRFRQSYLETVSTNRHIVIIDAPKKKGPVVRPAPLPLTEPK
jgi:hypothetical protein